MSEIMETRYKSTILQEDSTLNEGVTPISTRFTDIVYCMYKSKDLKLFLIANTIHISSRKCKRFMGARNYLAYMFLIQTINVNNICKAEI